MENIIKVLLVPFQIIVDRIIYNHWSGNSIIKLFIKYHQLPQKHNYRLIVQISALNSFNTQIRHLIKLLRNQFNMLQNLENVEEGEPDFISLKTEISALKSFFMEQVYLLKKKMASLIFKRKQILQNSVYQIAKGSLFLAKAYLELEMMKKKYKSEIYHSQLLHFCGKFRKKLMNIYFFFCLFFLFVTLEP